MDDVPPEIEAVLQQYEAALARNKKISDRHNVVLQQILRFLQSKPSLNRALEAAPEIALYIPQEFIDKVNEKTEKTKREDTPDVPIDVGAIAALAIAHRIHQGTDK